MQEAINNKDKHEIIQNILDYESDSSIEFSESDENNKKDNDHENEKLLKLTKKSNHTINNLNCSNKIEQLSIVKQ